MVQKDLLYYINQSIKEKKKKEVNMLKSYHAILERYKKIEKKLTQTLSQMSASNYYVGYSKIENRRSEILKKIEIMNKKIQSLKSSSSI